MAWLDVTEVLTDPEIIDSLACERRTSSVNESGYTVINTTVLPFVGVVCNEAGDVLHRLAEGQRVEGSLSIVTKFQLLDGRAGLSADIVQWKSNRYTVTKVLDYEHFGSGFVEAIVELIPLAGSS